MTFSKARQLQEYEQLAAKLIRLRNENGRNVIMLTSCDEKAGVSTLAYRVAITLAARSTDKVVLLQLSQSNFEREISPEGDIVDDLSAIEDRNNKPMIIKSSDKKPFLGASKNLSVISTMPPTMFPTDLVRSDQFSQFVDDLKQRFQYVIIDAPPITASSPSLSVAPFTDGVIFVIRSGHTRAQVLQYAKTQLEGVGAPMLGVILNMRKYHIPKSIYRKI